MSIPRYKINPLLGYLKDDDKGKFCEYRDYVKLHEDFEKLQAEVERLTGQLYYWRIEAGVDHARWLRTLEDLDTLRKAHLPK